MRAVFLDLNGTLVMPVQVNHPMEYHLLPGATEAIRLLNQHSFICPVITVQSRIDKQIFSLDDFAQWFRTLQMNLHQQGADVVGPYICPHCWHDECLCKKPQPRLYQQAAADNGIDIAQSVVVGNTIHDVQAARALRCTGCLVRTGWGEDNLRMEGAGTVATHVADDILAAAQWIIETQQV